MFRAAIFALFASFSALFAQVQDNFSDGNFTANPAWSGTTAFWTVNASGELQSNGSGTDTLYLSTPFAATLASAITEWHVKVSLGFAPSDNNFCKIYLASDQPDLTSAHGYYLRLGENLSADGIDLFRQDGTTATKIIDGTAGTIASGGIFIIKITRTASGSWEIFHDVSGTLASDGTATDATHSQSQYLGFWVRHTSTNATKFTFDDLYAGPPVTDQTPPTLSAVNILNSSQIEATFSEKITLNSAENINNYIINNSVNISNALLQNDSVRVLLTFSQPMVNYTTYTLSVAGITDKNGNSIPAGTPQSKSFLYFIPDIAAANDVIINELMADPTPQVLLPNAEWVEIYNNTNHKYFDLSGWKLGGATLPSVILSPSEYILVCATTDTSKLSGFGKTISPTTAFNSLTNGGEGYALRSKDNMLIDSIFYALSWYGDDAKADGGWSLERINPNPQTCPAAANWRASTAAAGGTPGAQNSVYSLDPDTVAPSLLSAELLAGDTLLLTFSESMDPVSLAMLTNYSFSPPLPAPLKALPDAPDYTSVRLKLSQLENGIIYTIYANNVTDCSGNPINIADSARFARAATPQVGELIFNELFPDPSPSRGMPGGEFVEIYNPGSKALSLSGCLLTDGSTTAALPATVLFPGEFLVLCTADYKSAFAPYGRVYSVSLPSLGNDRDSLILLNKSAQVLDFVQYSLSSYDNSVAEEGGITLERRDAHNIGCNLSGNWAASTDPSGGTPGRTNSITGTFVDIEKPSLQSTLIPDIQTISLTFSEGMSPLAEARFLLNPGGYMPAAVMYSGFSPSRFSLLFATELDSATLYTLVLDSVTDCSGNRLDTAITLGFPAKPQVGELVINELLFNPYSGGSDFVEIYNASNKVFDLGSLLIANTDPGVDTLDNIVLVYETQILLLPGEYAALTENRANIISIYNPPASARIFEIADLPTYNDTEGGCVLLRGGDSLQLDRFDYLDDYHYPTLVSKEGISLERISFLAPADNPTNWHSAASTVGYATPGYANSQHDAGDTLTAEVYVGYTTFTPNGDGDRDALPVRLRFSEPGSNVRLRISDSQGNIVRTIGGQWLLGTDTATIYWDGTDDSGQRLPIGIYVVIAERMKADGKTLHYRVPCVLGSDLK